SILCLNAVTADQMANQAFEFKNKCLPIALKLLALVDEDEQEKLFEIIEGLLLAFNPNADGEVDFDVVRDAINSVIRTIPVLAMSVGLMDQIYGDLEVEIQKALEQTEQSN